MIPGVVDHCISNHLLQTDQIGKSVAIRELLARPRAVREHPPWVQEAFVIARHFWTIVIFVLTFTSTLIVFFARLGTNPQHPEGIREAISLFFIPNAIRVFVQTTFCIFRAPLTGLPT